MSVQLFYNGKSHNEKQSHASVFTHLNNGKNKNEKQIEDSIDTYRFTKIEHFWIHLLQILSIYSKLSS